MALVLGLPLATLAARGLDFTHSSWSVLLLLVVAPLIEEILFRRGLQEELLRSTRFAAFASRFGQAAHARACIVVTAAAFAAAHLAVNPGWMAAGTLLPALAIGALYGRRRRLVPCVLLHAAFNFVWFVAFAQVPASV